MLASAAPFIPMAHRLVPALSGDVELSPRDGKTACAIGRLHSSSPSTAAEEFSDASVSSPASSRSSSPTGSSDAMKELGLISPTKSASVLVASHLNFFGASVVHAADYGSAVGTQVAPHLGCGILSTSGAPGASQHHCSFVDMRREQRDMTMCPSAISDAILSTSGAPFALQKHRSLDEMRREQRDRTMCPSVIPATLLSAPPGLEAPPGLSQTGTQFLSDPAVVQTTEEAFTNIPCRTEEQTVRAAIDMYKPQHVRGSYCGKGLKKAKLPEGTPVKKRVPTWVV